MKVSTVEGKIEQMYVDPTVYVVKLLNQPNSAGGAFLFFDRSETNRDLFDFLYSAALLNKLVLLYEESDSDGKPINHDKPEDPRTKITHARVQIM